MKNLKEKVSIIMPAYNEAERIVSSIDETVKTFREFGCSWELIIVDDGSSDGTYEKANALVYKYPGHLLVKKNSGHLGKGRAIKKALRYTSGQYVLFLDADMDLHPAQIQTLFDIMQLDDADVVIGSKLHPNSKVNYPLSRKIITYGYYFLVNLLFRLPCHDTQTGIKLFKVEVLKKTFRRVLVKKFAFDLEVLVNAHHLGFKIAEAPVILNHQRRYSRIGLHSIITTTWDTLAVFYRMYILKYYDRIDYYRRKNLGQEFRRMRR
jgi:glycosyltransferase involved in cell wall biosynthesis